MAANLMMELGEIFREGWWLNFSSVRGARQWDGQIVGKQGAWHALSERRHRDRPSALTIRASVAGFRTTHSLILRTVHRSRRRHCATRLSRRLFVSILLRQNSGMVDHSPRDVCRYLLERSGLIREPTPDRVDFIHRTFQDYLAGRAAVRADDIGALIAHAHNDQWRNVIVMAAGHRPPAVSGRDNAITVIACR